MNIFNKVTLQSLKKSRTRTIVTIIGVVLSAAMITAVATFAVSLQNYLINSSAVKYGSWHVEFLDVDSVFLQERSHDKGVRDTATIENIGYAALNDGKNPDKPYLFVTGFNEKAFKDLPIKMISGRLPQNSGEVLIPVHLSANGGVNYAVGDTLSLAVGDRVNGSGRLTQHTPYNPEDGSEAVVPKAEKIYTVVGICERPSFEEAAAPGYTLITASDPADQADSFNVFVTLDNPREVQSYAKDKAGGYNTILNDYVLRFMGLSDDTLFNTLLYSVGSILVLLIMLGSVFLIYNAFNISLNERTRQFGILASVGATSKQLRNSVLFEGLCIGVVGIPIGLAVGIGSITLVISVIAGNFRNILLTDVPLTLTISVPALIASAVISMITILISAYIPARKAAKRPVLESIRQTNEVKIDSKAVKTSDFAQRVYGLEGMLALKNFKRNKKRYRSIVLSLTLSVVLFVSANAFGESLKQAAKQSVVDSDYDICFTTQNMDESQLFRLYDKLKAVEGVYESSYQAVSTYSCTARASDFSERYREALGLASPDETVALPMEIQFVEDSVYLDFIKDLGLPAEEYTGQNAKMTAVAKAKGDSEQSGKRSLYNMFDNTSMDFTVVPGADDGTAQDQGKTVSLTFVDTIPVDGIPRQSAQVKSATFMIIAPYQLKSNFEPGSDAVTGLTFRSDNAAQSVAEMKTVIQSEGITANYSLYNANEIFEQNRNIVFVVDVFTYVFVFMISLIATANVFNTISTNIKLRRREFAMLRSVGMSDRDFSKMMNFECAFFGMKTLLFGVPIAVLLSWLIYRGMDAGGAKIGFIFPWASLIISVIGVFFLVFITMLYATRSIKKENIIDALRDDMT
ncbi:ABC transporter permease [Eubacterium maltosivorans]|uniref:ABC transporter permease n=1 Tax=Eubacterium maltosivorans TaxID=2041044 RepID=A0A4P9C6W4_EUBML|nr:ABC transporter permease [Eubacterium maltosivorans]QCT71160.1 ABC transporter permease [Eubacterium maltosivorans]